MAHKTALLLILTFLTGCKSTTVAPFPRQGVILAENGGFNGYQHGSEGSLFLVGQHVKRISEYGYNKQKGDGGTFSINLHNGSSFAIPNAAAAGLGSRPYGHVPADHDKFVKEYFLKLGIPENQISRVRTMTLLEASGRSEDKSTRPAVKAYYSVLERTVEGIPVPDSFAWARVSADGKVVAEAVYWPALDGDIARGAKEMRSSFSDVVRKQLESRTPGMAGSGQVVIRHASAWVDSSFEAFACIDIPVRLGTGSRENLSNLSNSRLDTASMGEIAVKHFDLNGAELFLPQERRNIHKPTYRKRQSNREK